MPTFACPLIPLAIARAGLKVKLCDIRPGSFDFDEKALRNICAQDKDVLAILAVHLGGIPLDLDTISDIAKQEKIFLVEDCAQSLGAEYRGKKTGSYGDFAFFSLCRGKGLTIYEGGIAITSRPEYARLLNTCADQINRPNILSEALKIFELFAYSIFYRPQLFWWVFRLPQIFWQTRKDPIRALGEYFQMDFPVHKVSGYRQAVGYLYFNRINDNLKEQRAKAALYLKALQDTPEVAPIVESAQTKASYPYLTLILKNQIKRDEVLKIFRNSGLGVSQVYLRAITDYPYLKQVIPQTDSRQAQDLAARTITLTTSIFLKERDLKRIIQKLKAI